LPGIKRRCPRLQRIWADGRYGGSLIAWVKEHFSCELEVLQRLEGQKGFVVWPKRWMVERSFAWLFQSQRLTKDYEFTIRSSKAWIDLAMISRMVRRLAKA